MSCCVVSVCVEDWSYMDVQLVAGCKCGAWCKCVLGASVVQCYCGVLGASLGLGASRVRCYGAVLGQSAVGASAV